MFTNTSITISVKIILTPLQSELISGDSTTNQLLYICNMFCEAVDNGKEVRVVFCDVSKALGVSIEEV